MKEMTITQAQLTINTLRIGTKQVTKAMWNQIPVVKFPTINTSESACLGYVLGQQKEYLVNINGSPFVTTKPDFDYFANLSNFDLSRAPLEGTCGIISRKPRETFYRFYSACYVDSSINSYRVKGLMIDCREISRNADEILSFVRQFDDSITREEVINQVNIKRQWGSVGYFIIGEKENALLFYESEIKRLRCSVLDCIEEKKREWSLFTGCVGQLYIAV